MGRTAEETSYARLFFVLSIALLGAIIWTFVDELHVRRPWRLIQTRFHVAEKKLLKDELRRAKFRLSPDHLRILDTRRKEAQARLERLKRQKGLSAGLQPVLAELSEIEERRAPVLRYRKLIEELDAINEKLDRSPQKDAYLQAQKAKNRAKAALKRSEARYTRLRSMLEEAEYDLRKASLSGSRAAMDSARGRRLKLMDLVTIAELERDRAERAYRKGRAEVEVHLEQKTRIVKELDRLSSSMREARGRLAALSRFRPQIHQIDLRKIGRVDRCPTCHLAAARRGFESYSLPPLFRSHPYGSTLLDLHPPERVGCTSCHGGQGRATLKRHAHAPSEGIGRKTHHWPHPVRQGVQKEAGCLKCHPGKVRYDAAIRCSVASDCPKWFYVGLQDGLDKETALTLAELWQMPALTKDSDSFPALQGRILAEVARKGGLVHLRPRNHKRYRFEEAIQSLVEASFLKTVGLLCRRSRAEPRGRCVDPLGRPARIDLAPTLSRGLHLVESLMCNNCHQIPGFEKTSRQGPDLTSVEAKIDRSYLVQFLANPRSMRPLTAMPDFWPASSRASASSQERVRKRQALAIASFLLASSKKVDLADERPLEKSSSGERLFHSIGCAACHRQIQREESTQVGADCREAFWDPSVCPAGHMSPAPDLNDLSAKTNPRWLLTWLSNPRSLSPATSMPSFRLSPSESRDLAAFLLSRRKKRASSVLPNPKDPRLVLQGKQLVRTYGCSACHKTSESGSFTRPGTDLTMFGLKNPGLLDFGEVVLPPSQQTWHRWVELKLEHPRIFQYDRARLFMPDFGLTDQEIEALSVVLAALSPDPELAGALGKKNGRFAEQADRFMNQRRCLFCHQRHKVGGYVLAGYDAAGHPHGVPSLDALSARVLPRWLFDFLMNPKKMRPGLDLRMPTYGLTSEQIENLVISLMGTRGLVASQHDVAMTQWERTMARLLMDSHGCAQCHSAPSPKDPPRPEGPDLKLAVARLNPSFLPGWLESSARWKPGVNMPDYYPVLAVRAKETERQNLLRDVYLKRTEFSLFRAWQKLMSRDPGARKLVDDPDRQLGLISRYLLFEAQNASRSLR